MYWRNGSLKDPHTNELLYIYEYFYIGHPIPEVVIKSYIAATEEEFLKYYKLHKQL